MREGEWDCFAQPLDRVGRVYPPVTLLAEPDVRRKCRAFSITVDILVADRVDL